jgi:MraZ protein
MYSFLGNIEAKADVKGRLFVPAQFRKQLDKADTQQLVMRKSDEYPFLFVYPLDVWEQEVALIESKLNLLDAEDSMFFMQYTSTAVLLDMDASGRVLIPKKYLQEIGVEDDAVFVGSRTLMAIWSKDGFDNHMKKMQADFIAKKKEKLGNK